MAQPTPPRTPSQGPLTTLQRDGSRRWLHPVVSPGRYHRARAIVAWSLITLFVALPWIPIAGKPAILLDLNARQFTFFGKTFFSHDTLLLPFLALTGIVGVALFTALFGRVWCGWACPQTVCLEFLFRPLESLLEGKAHVRARLASESRTAARLARTALRLALTLLLAFLLSATFVSYFTTPQALWPTLLLSPQAHGALVAAVLITTALVFIDFAWFREQTCIVACPYGRIQSALTDAGSIIVGYDSLRGEPRGKRSRLHPDPTLGDCVDCGACVRTCPTGIDIRDGLQLECIGCTQCIDACDDIMTKVHKPRGLIRYTSLDQLEGRPSRLLRPRVLAYAAIVAIACSVLIAMILRRKSFDLEVARKPGAPFYVQPDGRVVNTVRMLITNQQPSEAQFRVELAAPPGASLLTRDQPILVGANEVAHVEASILAPAAAFHQGRSQATLRVIPLQGNARDSQFVLLGPEGNRP